MPEQAAPAAPATPVVAIPSAQVEALCRALGGSGNIRAARLIAGTRVAVELAHPDAVQAEALRALGVRGVVPIGGWVHLIFGPTANAYAAALREPVAHAA
ncbi:MAG: hypothetical protein JOY66_09470 [Acetobacteraceae bacterium]|nr:hypothetical protein [Acetobacteraceae bacterium]